jgi:hypothetical protein
MNTIPFRVGPAAALLAILAAACARAPAEYSPGYSYVAVDPQGDGAKRPGILLPDACIIEKREELKGWTWPVPEIDPEIPPGCANAANLQQMAERESDLVEGRRLGAAPAAPTVRTAQKYIYGDEAPLGGAVGTGRETVAAPSAGQ